MMKSMFGTNSLTSMLRGGLEEQSATQRTIAARVARANDISTTGDFASTLKAKTGKPGPEVDLQQEMAALADTQIRFDASARLLSKAYAQFRTAIRG